MSNNGTTPRKSGRERVPNKRYTEDAFDGTELEDLLRHSSATTHSPTPPREKKRKEREPSEFDEADEVADEDEDDQISEGADARSSEDEGQGDPDADISDIVPDDELDGIVVSDDEHPGITETSLFRLNRSRRKIRVKSHGEPMDEVRSIGVLIDQNLSNRSRQVLRPYGDHDEDIKPLMKGLHKWNGDVTIPTRIERISGKGGLNYSFLQSDEDRGLEANEGWDWLYDESSVSMFKKLRSFDAMTRDEAALYLESLRLCCPILLGPPDSQNLEQSKFGDTHSLNEAWAGQQNPPEGPVRHKSSSVPHGGWILNCGASIQSLGWASNASSLNQYLAVSTKSHTDTEQGTTNGNDPHKARCGIQLWKFSANTPDGHTLRVDVSVRPQLAALLCLDVEYITHLSWCPFLRSPRSSAGETVAPCVLAARGSDGTVLVCEIDFSTMQDATDTEYLKIETAVRLQATETECTCITWISPSLLAGGCVNGHVITWDLDDELQSKLGDLTPELPLLYYPFHSTHITQIASCNPSQPDHVITIGMDGYIRLTSIIHPESEYITALRTRTGYSDVAWHERSQSAVTVDDTSALRAYNLRRFHTSIIFGRADSECMTIATSPVHSSVLVGGVNGDVLVTNPLSRVLDSGKQASAAGGWTQCWFNHDWRRGRPVDEDGQLDFPHGVSRIVKGFAPKKAKDISRVVPANGPVMATIFEDETCIKAVAWNPNLCAGGWAAAGMGSGLVMVEDLCCN